MKYKLLFLTVLFSAVSWGQKSIAAIGTNYTENFDSLTNGIWTDNTTATGWYAKTSAGTGTTIIAYGANAGSTTTGALYAFGVLGTNPLSDRALGIVNSNTFSGTIDFPYAPVSL